MYADVDISPSSEAGFSLLEVLIATAIMSLTSLALFQSMSRMLYISDRAIDVSEQSLENAVSNLTIRQLVDGLVPSWSIKPEDSFLGRRQSFSGVSANAVHSMKRENVGFTLSLRRDESEGHNLVYEGQNLSWILEKDLEETAYFEYLDKKKVWHPQWPPAKPITPPSEIALLEVELIKLPQAIRLSQSPNGQKALYVVGRHQTLPQRLEFGRDE